MAASKDPAKTQAAPERNDSTDQTVTELATVDGTEKAADLKDMAGVDGSGDGSQQQMDAHQGLKDAKANAKDPTKPVNPNADQHPFLNGPGSDIG